MNTSTWIFVAGVVLLLIPIPPFASIAGIATIGVAGVVKLIGH